MTTHCWEWVSGGLGCLVFYGSDVSELYALALSIEQPAPSGNEYGSSSELYALDLSSDHSRTSRKQVLLISVDGDSP